jgi:hypothetical protein
VRSTFDSLVSTINVDVFSNSLETERLFDALDSKTGNIFFILKAVSYKNSSN